MDVIVTEEPDGDSWSLADLLGRSMGDVLERPAGHFMIRPAGQADETMIGISPGPFRTLDAALAEIERHTRGVCRRRPGRDGP